MSRTLEAESGYRIIFIWRLSYLLILFSSVHGYPSRDHMFIYAVCSEEKYQPNAPFEGNLNSFMSSVVSSSSEVIYNSFAIGNGSSTPQEGNVYGLYQCRGDLHPIECSKCVERSVNEIGLVCPYALGGSLQLEGCLIRYEHSGDFLGKLDTSLRYKKCSKGVTSDVEFFRRRDDVLADLQTANGFRVSSSGLVEGFAQCLGDLTLSDCSSCLADAVGKLKTLCGSAAAAHVFLGQCYARYWASGYYHESDSSDDDQVGKSVAIIVGVFGGLAVLVVLLSICKKAAGK
ncbi:cysteine-rich repeat secretory protein 15 isoform X1 [Vigna radiata var. radiata]|uniref:Cysteine-rich repeat secretory protein 15 isoform X1 n=1 Tax=Vigna radiata var. radiata TaxID=3916 RepID=A0A1S3TFJ2_VIGRR|nr:cysteine-rich repeat secretory protein 15 isoform X1 [Vigna radiata var. radiata]